MIDIYDSEALVKCYRLLNKKCNAIDKFIENHSLYYGTSAIEYGSLDVFNNIIELMTRKNQLINLKVILDSAINSLDEKDKQIILVKINYRLNMEEFCQLLSLKERTAFRWIERAFVNLTKALNNSKYLDKLVNIMNKEIWITNFKDSVKDRRLAYKREMATNNL